MKITPNTWNRIRYTLYTPIYDGVVSILTPSRERSIREIDVKPGEKVLIVGAGTGLDLDYLPPQNEITAIDITPSMVEKIKGRAKRLDLHVDARVMDGHSLEFDDDTFDVVILHLILAVIPDPVQCMKEVSRVLKPNGRIAVFDKFLVGNAKPGFTRRILNWITSILFSDINRQIEPLATETGFVITADIPVNFGGNFRIIRLARKIT